MVEAPGARLAPLSDTVIEWEIQRVSQAIEQWAVARDLWLDSGFTSWLQRYNDEPSEMTPVLVMYTDGPMYRVWNGELDDEEIAFRRLLADLGYWYENFDGVTIHIHAESDEFARAFDAYARWQWVCCLVRPDFADVHEELYQHFAQRPDDLHRLQPRQFETLLSRVFQNQGFRAELGPGTNDGGVDVRLWHRDPIGDVLTLVQAKRYAKKRSIELEAVSALSGVVEEQRAGRGLLVTTSRFLPSARNFAARQQGRIVLADSEDVAKWCGGAAAQVIQDKSTLVSREYVERLLAEIAAHVPDRRLVHATRSHGTSINSFAIVLKESAHAALLMLIGKRQVSGDSFYGEEVPVLDASAPLLLAKETVFRTQRKVAGGGTVTYWGQRTLYRPWDGKPQRFDHMD